MPVGTRQNPRPTEEKSTSTGDLCLITRDLLDDILRENADIRGLQLESLRNIEKSLERISKSVTSVHAPNSADVLCEKLDGLIEAITRSNTTATPPPPHSIDETLKHRKTLVEKMVRHELLSKYYDELLNEEKPFARKAFRTKVNANASDIELRHRQSQTIDNVKREITIMQDRMVEFHKRKQALEEKIQYFLQENEDSRTAITTKVANEDREANSHYEKKLDVMKKTDQVEKRTLTNYLLKFQGDNQKTSNSSLRSHKPPWKKHPWE